MFQMQREEGAARLGSGPACEAKASSGGARGSVASATCSEREVHSRAERLATVDLGHSKAGSLDADK